VTALGETATAELHAMWRAGDTDVSVEEELRRRHPELGAVYAAAARVQQVETRELVATGALTEQEWMVDMCRSSPCADAAYGNYRALRDALVQYDDAYLDGPALARRLGLQEQTIRVMSARKVLPRADLTVGGRPAWHWSTVREIEGARAGKA
jgi:hypothetical protein